MLNHITAEKKDAARPIIARVSFNLLERVSFGKRTLFITQHTIEVFGNMTEDFSPKALVVVERLWELLG